MALLAWIPNKKMFLKIQKGTGDNMSDEDIANGYCDYVLWNIFAPGALDTDKEWHPRHLDGGMLLLKEE